MQQPGSTDRPLAVAVIGSGPSGFYAIEALLKTAEISVRIDLFERLPTPFGLVRGGVAPDHQKIKSVTAVYTKIAKDPRVRFFGNVAIGRDITVDDLRAHYDQIIYAFGCESDKRLNIPGEDLTGSYSATDFVGWYNGHPDHQDHVFDLSCESVAVVGIGNVAIDVARILARDPESLAKTDIASGALDQLRRSQVRTVWLLGRRGAAEAAFSPAEIEELGDLGYADLVVRAEDVAVDDSSEVSMADVNVKKKVEYLRKHAKLGEGKSARKIRLRLMVSPVEILGEGGRVTDLRMEHNTLTADAHGRLKAVGTGHQETIPVGMVLRSVGYRGRPLSGVPFDEKTGTIANSQGRVTDGVSGPPLPGEYAVGWAKRGPSGLIGTNRADSVATVNLMVLDLKVGKLPARRVDASLESIPKLLSANKIRWIDFQHWEKLDAIETAKGKAAGKPRQKFTRIDEMLAAIKKS